MDFKINSLRLRDLPVLLSAISKIDIRVFETMTPDERAVMHNVFRDMHMKLISIARP